MATVSKMSNVTVAMQSALAASVTISAITKAAPGALTTSAAHSLTTGDYVVLTVNGMQQLNGKVYRVIVDTTTTLRLEDVATGTGGGVGIDTTLFDTFSSGSLQKITFGTTITTAANVAVSGGEFDFIDTTTIHSNAKSQIPGAANPVKIDLTHLWDPTDAGQIAMKAASDAQAQRAFKLVFGTGGKQMLFTGYVGYIMAPAGNAQDKITSPSSITAFGTPTYYSA